MNAMLLKKRLLEKLDIEPQDAVKLVFQSEFGCGHLLAEEAVCAATIAQEMATVAKDPSASAFEAIGGGLCRLNLHAPAVRCLSPATLARMMAETSLAKQGTVQGLEASFAILRGLCQAADAKDALPFSLAKLDAYWREYQSAGYPVLSHSERYKKRYVPAYRVVLRGYGDALPVLAEIERMLSQQGQCVLVIEGDCGAGKTTLANLIAPLYHANLIRMDEFFLPPAMRTEERFLQPGGNTHYERFAEEVLQGLLHGKSFAYTSYDCHTGQSEKRTLAPTPVTVIEGSYSQHPFLEGVYQALPTLKVFLTVDQAEQLKRLKKRNPALLPRFEQEWIPLEKAYFQAYDRENQADLRWSSLPWEEEEP